MARVDGAVLVVPFLYSAVVGGENDCHTLCQRFVHNDPDVMIHCFDGRANGVRIFDVSHNVNVSEVRDEKIIARLPQRLNRCRCNSADAQFGHFGVVLDLRWRRNDDSLLSRERILSPAVEEEREMGRLLRLGDFDLRQSRARQRLAEGILNRHRGEGHLGVESIIVLNHGNEVDSHPRLCGEVTEAVVREALGEFDFSLTSDVVKHHVIPVSNAAHRPAISIDQNQRLQRLVILPGVIRSLNCLSHDIVHIRIGPLPIVGHRKMPRLAQTHTAGRSDG